MSFSSLRLSGLGLLALLAACTASPLYGPAALDPDTGRSVGVEALAGRIQVAQADDRTDQIVRNRLLFRLNGGAPVTDPLYELRLDVLPSTQAVSVQRGTGVPTAQVYRVQATYSLVRLPQATVIASGERAVSAPYDRSEQLFAAQRALIDARENAGDSLADQIAIAVAPALRAELAGTGAARPR